MAKEQFVTELYGVNENADDKNHSSMPYLRTYCMRWFGGVVHWGARTQRHHWRRYLLSIGSHRLASLIVHPVRPSGGNSYYTVYIDIRGGPSAGARDVSPLRPCVRPSSSADHRSGR